MMNTMDVDIRIKELALFDLVILVLLTWIKLDNPSKKVAEGPLRFEKFESDMLILEKTTLIKPSSIVSPKSKLMFFKTIFEMEAKIKEPTFEEKFEKLQFIIVSVEDSNARFPKIIVFNS